MKKRGFWAMAVLYGCGGLVSCTPEDAGHEGDNFTEGTPYVTKVLEYVPAPGPPP